MKMSVLSQINRVGEYYDCVIPAHCICICTFSATCTRSHVKGKDSSMSQNPRLSLSQSTMTFELAHRKGVQVERR